MSTKQKGKWTGKRLLHSLYLCCLPSAHLFCCFACRWERICAGFSLGFLCFMRLIFFRWGICWRTGWGWAAGLCGCVWLSLAVYAAGACCLSVFRHSYSMGSFWFFWCRWPVFRQRCRPLWAWDFWLQKQAAAARRQTKQAAECNEFMMAKRTLFNGWCCVIPDTPPSAHADYRTKNFVD